MTLEERGAGADDAAAIAPTGDDRVTGDGAADADAAAIEAADTDADEAADIDAASSGAWDIRLPSALVRVVRPRLVVPIVAALAFWAGWWLLESLTANGFFGNLIISDVPIFLEFGDKMASGLVPYRDFPMEYPPAALPIFLLPSLLTPSVADAGAYAGVFENLMLACGMAAAAFMAITLQSLRASALRLAGAITLVAVSPVLVGPVILSHFDLWPAAVTAAALAAIVARHERVGAGLLGLAVMAKIYPVVILPVLVLYLWRRSGRREALTCLAIAVAVMAVCLLPFAIVAPGGIIDALTRQATRPLQVESLGAATLLFLHSITGFAVTVTSGSGSQNLSGPLPDALALLSTVALVASLIAIWWWFGRRPRAPEGFVRAAVGSVVAYVAFGKVLSPQYLAWLIPLVPLLRGRRGVIAALSAGAAYLFTEAYFPSRYFPMVRDFDAGAARLVFARDLSLVALLGAATLPLRRLWTAAGATAERLRRRLPVETIRANPGQVLLLVLIGFFVLRMIWITRPDGSLVFDETYYVNAARVIDGLPVPAGQPYADAPAHIDPNKEHPPLGKVAIAASIRVFGDNAFGWRVPSIVASLIALLAVYGIVIAAGESAWLGILAVVILGLDNLTFVHGRIGTLDMLATAPILVGAWLALRRRPALAGIAFATGSLVKVTAFFGFLAFLLWEGLALWRRRRAGEVIGPRQLRSLGLGTLAYSVVGIGGLALLDRAFTSFATPVDHLKQMFGYGIALTGGPSPSGIASNPWDWLVGGGHFDYLRVDVSVLVNGVVTSQYPSVEFQGALSPILIGAAPLAVIFCAWLAVRSRHRLTEWALIWLAANYLPYYALAIISHRITYLYYALPAIPAVAVLTAVFLLRSSLPRVVAWGYLAATAVAFVAYFPFRQIP